MAEQILLSLCDELEDAIEQKDRSKICSQMREYVRAYTAITGRPTHDLAKRLKVHSSTLTQWCRGDLRLGTYHGLFTGSLPKFRDRVAELRQIAIDPQPLPGIHSTPSITEPPSLAYFSSSLELLLGREIPLECYPELNAFRRKLYKIDTEE